MLWYLTCVLWYSSMLLLPQLFRSHYTVLAMVSQRSDSSFYQNDRDQTSPPPTTETEHLKECHMGSRFGGRITGFSGLLTLLSVGCLQQYFLLFRKGSTKLFWLSLNPGDNWCGLFWPLNKLNASLAFLLS